MMSFSYRVVFLFLVLFAATFSALAQEKKNSKPTQTPEPAIENPSKRNERPDTPSPASAATRAEVATHVYEFVRPGFTYSRIIIEHDDAGKGKISFLKDDHDELLTDPIELSKVTAAKISEALATLKFLDSTDEYQYSKDYSHMGNVTFTLTKGGRSRTVKFNWTDNPAAKTIMDEYRRISNEYTWRFEMLLARENMPLQTPGLMETIEAYVRRNEISDPPQMVPFLTQLSLDERLPLMARNKALKLIKKIEESKK